MKIIIKKESKGVHEMCRVMEDLRNESYSEGLARGVEQGELKKSKEIAISMAEDGEKIEKISRLIKVSEDTIREWLSSDIHA